MNYKLHSYFLIEIMIALILGAIALNMAYFAIEKTQMVIKNFRISHLKKLRAEKLKYYLLSETNSSFNMHLNSDTLTIQHPDKECKVFLVNDTCFIQCDDQRHIFNLALEISRIKANDEFTRVFLINFKEFSISPILILEKHLSSEQLFHDKINQQILLRFN